MWVAAEGCLLFNDIPGDARWRWTAERGADLVTRPTCKANGMCLANHGDLIVCEHISSSVTRIRSGVRETVAFHYEGRYLNSPNDVVARRADGSIYFSDPAGGREFEWMGVVRARDLDFQGVYRIPPARPRCTRWRRESAPPRSAPHRCAGARSRRVTAWRPSSYA